MNQSISDKGVCRTGPATQPTPGLLIMMSSLNHTVMIHNFRSFSNLYKKYTKRARFVVKWKKKKREKNLPQFSQFFTESALRPIQSIGCNVHVYVCCITFCNLFKGPIYKGWQSNWSITNLFKREISWKDIGQNAAGRMLLCIVGELARGVPMDVAVGVSDMWQVTGDMWHMTHDTWHVRHDTWF